MRVERKRSTLRNTTWLSVAGLGVSHVTRARLESTVVTDLMIVDVYTYDVLSVILTKGDNIPDFLFISKQIKTCLKRVSS